MTVSCLKPGTPLVRRALIAAAIVWALGFVAAPNASADSFTLNQIFCNCLPPGTNAGTVTLTQNGTDVTAAITLAGGLTFHESGLDAFGFNAPTGLTAASFAFTPGVPGWSLLIGSPTLHEDGAGYFRYGFACTPAPNGCVGDPTTFTFTIHGVTLADIETTEGGTSNVDLAANVAVAGVSGCTGMVGAGSGPSNLEPWGGFNGASPCGTQSTTTTGSTTGGATTPEPASLLLLGTGLAMAARRLKPASRNRA